MVPTSLNQYPQPGRCVGVTGVELALGSLQTAVPPESPGAYAKWSPSLYTPFGVANTGSGGGVESKIHPVFPPPSIHPLEVSA